MSDAATIRRTGTPRVISTRRTIRSSKATTHRKAGAGATSTRSCSISATAPPRITARFRAIIEPTAGSRSPKRGAGGALCLRPRGWIRRYRRLFVVLEEHGEIAFKIGAIRIEANDIALVVEGVAHDF